MAKKEAKGKKAKKNKKTSKKYSKYKIEGDKVTRHRSCPRCGPGVFLMDGKKHKIRSVFLEKEPKNKVSAWKVAGRNYNMQRRDRV